MIDPPVVLLTGCASGIGRHMAGVFAAGPYRLLLTDINYEILETHFHLLALEDRAVLRKLDVRNARDWENAARTALIKWGRIDILINIAGYLKPAYIHECQLEDIPRHMDINVTGAMLGTRIIAEHMVNQGCGHIINIASLAGVAPVPGLSLYSASKFALRGFSLATAQELRPHGVYVTAICPDAVDTPMLDRQRHFDEAALTFSGKRFLTVHDLERVIIEEALPKKPAEILLPRSRGWLAKVAAVWPTLAFRLGPLLRKRGIRRQAMERARRTNQRERNEIT